MSKARKLIEEIEPSSIEAFGKAAAKAGFKGATNMKTGKGTMNANGVVFDYSIGDENVYVSMKEIMVKNNPEGLVKAISDFSKAISKLG